MGIERLDHLNLRTARLAEMIGWYGRVLDMHPGPRPDFAFAGAWLYANGQALVHLVEIPDEAGANPADLKLEHGAFAATGLAAMIARLEDLGERFRVSPVPGLPVVQVNLWDPDGNHLHVDYAADEPDAERVSSPRRP